MAVRATVWSGYCLVGLMSIGLQSMGCCKVRLLSCQVTVWSGYCLFGLLSSQATVFWVNVHWACVSRGCVLGEVFMGLVSGYRLVLHFSYYSFLAFLVVLSVILLSMQMILLSTLNMIRRLICDNN